MNNLQYNCRYPEIAGSTVQLQRLFVSSSLFSDLCILAVFCFSFFRFWYENDHEAGFTRGKITCLSLLIKFVIPSKENDEQSSLI